MSNNIKEKSSLNPAELARSQDENSQVIDQSSSDFPITNDDCSTYSGHEDSKSVTNFDQISKQVSQLDEEKELDTHGLKNAEESESLSAGKNDSYTSAVSNEKQAFLVELPDLSDEYYFNSIKEKNGNTIEAKRQTFARKYWVKLTWLLTWWIPSSLFTRFTKTTRSDIQMKWREKVVICILIFSSWLTLIFIGIGSGLLSHFSSNNYSANELAKAQGKSAAAYMYGSVYDLNKLAKYRHGKSPNLPDGITADDMEPLEGKDITSLFPLDPQVYCQGLDNIPDHYEFNWLADISYSEWNPIVASQDFPRWVHRTDIYKGMTVSKDPLWYKNTALPYLKGLRTGTVVYPKKIINQYRDWQWNIGVINGKVYDISIYVNNTRQHQDKKWMPTEVVNLFKPNAASRVKNGDITELWNGIQLDSPERKEAVMTCLDNLFYVGEVDQRELSNNIIYNLYSSIYNSVSGFIKSL